MGACWHASQCSAHYVRVEETGNKRGRETNDRKMQLERNDTDEGTKTKKDERDWRGRRAGGNDSGNGAEEP